MFTLKSGLALVLFFAGLAFWILIFLASFIPGWIGMTVNDMVQEKLQDKRDPFANREELA